MITTHKKTGFTLIELLVVCTIIIILSTLGMVAYSAAGKSARDGKRKADMETARQALTLYRQQYPTYPSTDFTTTMGTLNSFGYISQPLPIDPGGTVTNPYTYTPSGSSYCVCAETEQQKGNSNSLTSCADLSLTTGTFYCAAGL